MFKARFFLSTILIFTAFSSLAFAENNLTNNNLTDTSSVMSNDKTTAKHNQMWICTTNASSAQSGSSEYQADQSMEKNAKSFKDAASYAYLHCRDCTKITCSMQ